MNRLIHWSLANRVLVLTGALLLTVFGFYTAMRMPVDVFPDLTAPTVTIITEAHGMSPMEVETQVTFPVETAVNGASGVRRVRSATTVGISVVWVEFEWGTDIRNARQIVSEKISTVSGSLPREVERPVLAPQSSIMGEILFLALSSEQHSPAELRSYAETVIRRRLLAVSGVSQVTPIGGAEKQFQAIIQPDALLAHGVALNQVIRALEEGNENISAGIINAHGQEWLVTGVGPGAQSRRHRRNCSCRALRCARFGGRLGPCRHQESAQARRRFCNGQTCCHPRHPEATGREHT